MKNKVFTLLLLTLPLFCSSQILWDDFEQTRIGYYEFVHGGMTTRFENPDLASTVNSSPLCAQYVRNPGELWDVLVIVANGPINDVSDYVNGSKKMTVDVFSPLAGIPVQITLEDSSLAGATNYPTGRHSIYLGTTTLTNEWETIELTFDSKPDPTMSDVGLTSVILLFNGGTNTNDTYYFDNLFGPEFNNQCDGLILDPSVNFADWDCNWNLGICPSASPCTSFDYVSGWLNQSYNPDHSTINTSKYSGEYTRNPDPNGEDVLIAYFTNGVWNVNSNLSYFNFKIYGPPRPIYMSFQDASSNEVYAYNSAITTNNQWEQFSVDLSSVASQSITRFVLFLDQTVVNWDMYYLDDFNLSSTPLFVQDINDSEIINVYPQPAKDYLNIDLKLNNNDVKRLDLYDIQGKVLSTLIHQNSDHVSLDVSMLDSGIYFVKVQSRNDLFTRKIQIIR
jgi:hypothetical protein|tara:strand:- start:2120 stop:3469 length:1350 start_codon:yes stop_codon:yes gene_type:complete